MLHLIKILGQRRKKGRISFHRRLERWMTLCTSTVYRATDTIHYDSNEQSIWNKFDASPNHGAFAFSLEAEEQTAPTSLHHGPHWNPSPR